MSTQPAPLATPIQPPQVVLPAASSTPTPAAAPAQAATAPAPAAHPAPVSVFGDLTSPSVEADDETLNYALKLGLGADLGLPTTPAAPAEPAAATAPAETPEQIIARLTAENAALKAGTTLAPEGTPPAAGAPASPETSGQAAPPAVPALPAIAPVTPTAEAPLVNVRTPEQLALTERAATQLREWVITHRQDGGTLPLELAQLVEDAEAARHGRQPAKVTTAPEIDAASMPQIELSTDRMLSTVLPRHRAVLQGHQQTLAILHKDHAALLNSATEEGKVFATITRQYPQLLALPEGLLLARDLATGFLANRPKAKEPEARSQEPGVQTPAPAAAPAPAPPALTVLPPPTAPTTTGQAVPVAPAAPLGTVAVGGRPVSQSRLDAAEERMRAGTASEEDFTILSAAAV